MIRGRLASSLAVLVLAVGIPAAACAGKPREHAGRERASRAATVAQPPAGAQVVLVPAAADPGGIALVLIEGASAPVARVSATFRGRPLAVFVGTDARLRALIGVDLTTPPGRYPVVVTIPGTDGARRLRGALEVRPKQFPREDLTVPEQYVAPDAATLARIHRDAAALERVLGRRSPERLWSGSFMVPAEGPFGSPFGLRRFFNGEPRQPHMGQDIRVPEGTPVVAAARGRVVLAAPQYFGGNTIVLDHGLGVCTMYLHLATFRVREGSLVDRGALLGYSGRTGRATGAHLHWGAYVSGARVDPLPLLRDPAAEQTETDDGGQVRK
jgi:murein DD-endopeptidase MepM/ murein hydrolase activator NlpD